MTTRLLMPVASSVVSVIDMPSTRSSKPTVPSTSARIGTGIGIPLDQALAALDLVALVDPQLRTELDTVNRALGHRPTITTAMLRAMAMRSPSEFRATLRLRMITTPSKFDSTKDWSAIVRRAADVEGTHGELRAGLADRLRRDDADGLAHG
jgi:hypothetical protein